MQTLQTLKFQRHAAAAPHGFRGYQVTHQATGRRFYVGRRADGRWHAWVRGLQARPAKTRREACDLMVRYLGWD